MKDTDMKTLEPLDLSQFEFAGFPADKILRALPFADNDAGLKETGEFIREALAEVKALRAENERLREAAKSLDRQLGKVMSFAREGSADALQTEVQTLRNKARQALKGTTHNEGVGS